MTETRSSEAPAAGPAEAPEARVWVLDDPRAGTAAQALGIAERLGMPFRRVPLTWNWLAHLAGLAPGGSLLGLSQGRRQAVGAVARGAGSEDSLAPDIVLSAGRRSAAVALWMKTHFGCRIVHCMSPGLGGLLRADLFDLLVVPGHDNPREADNVLPILGAPHRVSPLALRQAAVAWEERLAHLPRPRVALLVGGSPGGTDMPPARAHTLARKVARLTASLDGTVLATTSRRTGAEATEALSAGLSRVMHVLYRWGEPGPNPYLGFLATADAIVVTADSVSMISEACATGAPVYFALPEQAGRRQARFIASFVEAGYIRPLADSLAPWPRPVLDESARVATEIHRRFGLPSMPG
jgi:mitochondrial fission protein ELM1